MNQLFFSLGIEGFKPLLTTLLLPPLPLLLATLLGALLLRRRPGLGVSLVLVGTVGGWLLATPAVGEALTRGLLAPPPALTTAQVRELRRAPDTAIVVLGGGRRLLAPEYGMASLNPFSAERLRYGLWLGRETALPVAFSGGTGRGAPPGTSEAEIAARVAEREFGRPLRWTESDSRDTRENAARTVALLAPAGVRRIVLVTHDFHMQRAQRNFERAAAHAGMDLQIVAAPMGVPAGGPLEFGDWLPSAEGQARVRLALREWLGWIAGA
jgi:uncharacterized SAM-binding protein YcdF (DUF218 family)